MMGRHLIVLGLGLLIGVGGTLAVMPRSRDISAPSQALSSTELAMERTVPELNLGDVRLDEALKILSERWNVRLEPQWNALAQMGVRPQERVHFHGYDVSLQYALQAVLAESTGQLMPAACVVEEDRILIGPPSLQNRQRVVRAYEIGDLVDPVQAQAENDSEYLGSDAFVEFLEHFFWGSGDFRLLGSRLIVCDTRENHGLVRATLAAMRDTPALPEPPPSPVREIWVWQWNERAGRWVMPEPSAAEGELRRRIASVDLKAAPLEQAIAYLREQTGARMLVDWGELERVGLHPKSPVTLRARDIPLWGALTELTAGYTFGRRAGYTLRRDLILVTSEHAARRLPVTRVYDIRDWLQEMGFPILTYRFDRSSSVDREIDIRRADFLEELLLLIGRATDPPTSNLSAAAFGPAIEHNGRLVITETWENHERIESLVNALRAEGLRKRTHDDE